MKKIAIIYYSETGNTEEMADILLSSLTEAGADVEKFQVGDFDGSLDDYDGVLLGCPAKGDEELEESEFEPFFEDSLESLKNTKLGIFGSYEWNDGEWIIKWADRCKEAGLNLFMEKGLKVYGSPDDEAKEECIKYANDFLDFVE